LGRRPQALEGYQKALEILATEAGRPGGEDPGLQAEQASYHQAVGDVHHQAGDRTPALQAYQAAEAIWRRLGGVSKGPADTPGPQPSSSANAAHRLALAIVLDRIGTVYHEAKELERAAPYYAEALGIEWAITRGEHRPPEMVPHEQQLAKMFLKLGDL